MISHALGGRTDGGTDLPDPPLPRVWITEGDWGQRVWFTGHGLPVERSYVYVYNGQEPESRRTGDTQDRFARLNTLAEILIDSGHDACDGRDEVRMYVVKLQLQH